MAKMRRGEYIEDIFLVEIWPENTKKKTVSAEKV
jgi:hypothetical protein